MSTTNDLFQFAYAVPLISWVGGYAFGILIRMVS